jgi:hypothetical protein
MALLVGLSKRAASSFDFYFTARSEGVRKVFRGLPDLEWSERSARGCACRETAGKVINYGEFRQ